MFSRPALLDLDTFNNSSVMLTRDVVKHASRKRRQVSLWMNFCCCVGRRLTALTCCLQPVILRAFTLTEEHYATLSSKVSSGPPLEVRSV